MANCMVVQSGGPTSAINAALAGVVEESMESGMASHIAKPFDISHLVNTINEHIAKGSSEAAR